jgi:small ligand-binding sensory domain FIST
MVDGRVHDRGAVGVVLGDGVLGTPIVSQGCRPVGPVMTVTAAEGNVLLGLAGQPAVGKLEQVVAGLPPEEQALVTTGLQLGIAMDEYADEHTAGDFLVRGVAGVDRDRAGLVVGDLVEVGRTVQFQVRDAATAEADLAGVLGSTEVVDVAGALLFSCTGRGAGLFGSPDHDVLAVREGLGTDHVAGFFAAGEIGPVGGRNHLHGFTASVLALGSAAPDGAH